MKKTEFIEQDDKQAFSMKKIFPLVLIGAFIPLAAGGGHFRSHVDVKVGELTPRAAAGQKVFNEKCGACHGINGEGTLAGPPLIHDIYNPGHHDNGSFSRAIRMGVKQHHWPFGDMPAQPQVGFSDLAGILAFVRELQRQNGIVKRAHRM